MEKARTPTQGPSTDQFPVYSWSQLKTQACPTAVLPLLQCVLTPSGRPEAGSQVSLHLIVCSLQRPAKKS